MIPKKIHYCWFGKNPLPPLAEKCLASWKKYCPDYEIIRWDEDNYDISSAPLYVRQAYSAGKWAFVTDYVRLKTVFDHGGIYLDTDVELVKPLDDFLRWPAYFGFENSDHIATGLGFGAEAGVGIVRDLFAVYDDIPFISEDSQYDLTPCPERNTAVLLNYGLRLNNEFQRLSDGSAVFPAEYFCPLDYHTLRSNTTDNTVSIHWYSGSWQPAKQRFWHKLSSSLGLARTAKRLIGEEKYQKIKKNILR